MIQRQPLNPTHVYTYHVEGLKRAEGFVMNLGSGLPQRILDASDGVILDCQVSYDGTRILFSWKRTMDEPFGIWSIGRMAAGSPA
jgi:Tol biopolymer transport system component